MLKTLLRLEGPLRHTGTPASADASDDATGSERLPRGFSDSGWILRNHCQSLSKSDSVLRVRDGLLLVRLSPYC